MIIAYSTRHRGYTAYGFPLRIKDPTVAMPFRQLTGYHPTPQDAREWARKGPGRSISSAHPSEPVGTITARLKSEPLTATQAAEARDKFNEAYPNVKGWWDEMKDNVSKEANIPRRMLDEPKLDDDAFSRFAAHVEGYDAPEPDQQRPPAGVSKSSSTQERASSVPNRRQRAPK